MHTMRKILLIAFCMTAAIGAALFAASSFLDAASPKKSDERKNSPYDVAGPVNEPRLFVEGIISTIDDEMGATFSPDGSDFYFVKQVPYTTFPRYGIICVSHFRDGRWSTPEVVPFSGKYLDWGPKVSPDGKTMFFASTRPAPGHQSHVIRIWSAEKTANGWAEPQPLREPVNAPDDFWNLDPSVTRDGTLYFASDRGDHFHFQIYRARMVDGKYAEPEKLGPAVNSKFNDSEPYISPDEKILIFASSGQQSPPYLARETDLNTGGHPYLRADLYYSVQQDGEWTPARHLEHGINSVAEESYPSLTPDGRFLFFSSERSSFLVPMAHRLTYDVMERDLHSIFNGRGNIFFIAVEALGISEQAGKP
jgi:hypothetical protein